MTGSNHFYIAEWNADDVLDVTNTLTYSITSQTVSGAFTINSDTGTITVANGSLLDFETNATHTVTVRVSDGTATYDKAFTVTLANMTETGAAPTDLSPGIALNTDGGNNAYLRSTSGGSVFGGLTALTIETQYSLSSNASNTNAILSYAVAGADNEVALRISPTGVLSLSIRNTDVTTSSAYAQLLDGKVHSVAASWDNTRGDVTFYVDGQRVQTVTGIQTGTTLSGGGTLVLGQDQDSIDGGYNSTQVFSGTLHDLRIWNRAISAEQIANNYQQKINNGPTGLVANWQMQSLVGGTTVVDSIGGVNLTIANVPLGNGFLTSTPSSGLRVTENVANGSTVGYAIASDAYDARDIVLDGTFREAPNPGSLVNYTAGQSFGNWTVRSGNVDLNGTYFQTTPLGGWAVDLNGTAPGAIYQNLSTVAGRQYQVVFAMSGNWDGGGGDLVKDLRVSAAGQSQDFSMAQPTGWSTTNMLYSNRSFTFTATGSSTDLDFASLDSAGGAFGPVIGDIRVLEIPPAVQTILSSDATLRYDAATSKFYRYIWAPATFDGARTGAMAATVNGVAGQLVTIGSAYENALVFDMMRGAQADAWIGATDATAEGTWRWTNGSSDGSTFWIGTGTGTLQPGQYANWIASEPNDLGGEDFAYMRYQDGLWNDATSAYAIGYIAEWDASEVLSNLRYSLTDNAGGRFAINANTGEITVANSSLIDFETSTSHNVTVQVTDAGGNSYSEAMAISIVDAADTLIDLYSAPALGDADIVGYYSFTSSGGLGRDDAGGNANMTLSGSPTQATRTGGSGALNLAGGASNQYGEITGISTGGAMSFAAWVRFDTNGSWQRVFDFGQTDSGGIGNVYVGRDGTTNNLTFTIEKYGIYTHRATAVNAISDGTWMHFAATIDATGNMSLYVNGSLAATQTGVALETGVRANNFIGKSHFAGDAAFDGAIDDFLITRGVLSASTIQSLYQQSNQFTVAENSANGTIVGTMLATHGVPTSTYTYSLTNSAGGRFAIDSQSGQITVANGTLLDFETSSSHTVVVRVTDQTSATRDETITISLTNTIDAPILTPYGPSMILTEDAAPYTATVASLLGSSVSDPDAGALTGIAITSLSGTGGTLQYSLDGTNWNTVPSVNSTSALLLRSTDSLRFTPNGANGGTTSVVYRAWDQTTGTAGSQVNVTTNGGMTAFSSATDTVTVTITSVNDAPTITNNATYTLTGTDENTTSTGTLASTILTGTSWADVDTSALSGLAITATTGTGTWQYSTDGTTWNAFGAVSSTSALLITSTTQVRYVPNGNNGETATFTYKAWDQTSGTASTNATASYATTASSGGSTAFSTSNATASMTVTSVNDAPTITNIATYTLTGTDENTTSTGTLASTILTGTSWADVDTGALSGLAITATTGSGTWQYSTDGNTWNAFGAVSSTSALLITSTTQVRYVPNGNNGETATFTYKAWDRTSGTASTNATANYATTASSGGTTAFSSSNATASMTVTSVNDAPTITNNATYTLTGTDENTTSTGTLASTILTGTSWADVDTGALSGLAITATTGSGTWQYSTDGNTWNAFGAVSSTSALLITSTTQVRYVPNGNNGETATFTYKAWDRTSGTASTNATASYATTASSGGTTAFSTSNATASMTVTSVNDAPTITNGSTYTLTGTDENTTSTGTLASTILTGTSWADVDTGALSGLAITATTGSGTWQYSTDGNTWNAFGAVSSTSALLITSTTQVRYVPNGNNGETATFTYKAWDRTSGTASTNATASYATTASSGGTTAFSTSNATASMTVTSVNDAPTITNGSTYTLTGTDENTTSTGTLASTILTGTSWADVDTGALSGLAITATTGTGTWQYSTDGTTWNAFGAVSSTSALLVTSTTQVRYVPNGNNGETATFTYKAWDQTSGTASTNATASYATTASSGGTTAFSTSNATASMTVTSVNDAPTITNGSTYTLTGTDENTTSTGTLASTILTGTSWADVDTGALSGLAITATTGSGTWQYSTDGTTWNAFGAVSSTSALLVTSTTQVRYVPNGNNGETATFTYKAWDQTSGTASTNATASYATTASSGGTTAFLHQQRDRVDDRHQCQRCADDHQWRRRHCGRDK